MDAGSSSRDGNPGKGKRPRQSSTDKPREPKRGLGVAELERMRAEEARKDGYLRGPFNQAHISGPGIGSIQRMMSYGTGGNLSGLFILPFARPPSTSGAASDVNPSNKSPPKMLQLFPGHREDKNDDCKREGDHDLPVEAVEPTSKNPNDPLDELDLELELKNPNDPRDELDLEPRNPNEPRGELDLELKL